MTQMLLFDSPAHAAETTTAAVLPTQIATPVAAETQNIAAAIEHESGLNHMGDLARLVLLRYDLVAKRRAAIRARK